MGLDATHRCSGVGVEEGQASQQSDEGGRGRQKEQPVEAQCA